MSGAIVDEGSTVIVEMSLGATVEESLVITVDVGAGTGKIVGGDGVGTRIG